MSLTPPPPSASTSSSLQLLQDGNSNHGSLGSSGAMEEESPFFADITLDLAEAHDIAETPEPRKLVMSQPSPPQLQMPNLSTPSPMAASAAIATGKSTTTTTTTTNNSDLLSSESGGAGAGDNNDYNDSGDNAEPSTGNVALAYMGSPKMTPSLKRWPRDIPWAVAFCLFVPISLFLPMLAKVKDYDETVSWMATARPARLASTHTLLWGYIATLLSSRFLYRTMGGGDGDDARHVVSQALLASAPISVSVYMVLVATIYLLTPRAFHYSIIPLWYLARNLYLFRRWKRTATTPGGRQAFFQALSCMALDILSRSLRRSSFYRVISVILLLQLLVIYWWRLALLGALRSNSNILLLMAIIGGKWATGVVARLLTFIACGGVANWFQEQNRLVEGLQLEQRDQQQTENDSNKGAGAAVGADNNDGNFDTLSQQQSLVPEAYRTADASAYKPSLEFDEGIDDDFEDEDDTDMEALTNKNNKNNSSSNFSNLASSTFQTTSSIMNPRGSTVKQLLFSALSISFGSVCQCGLLGGVAQFVWSQIRKIDAARASSFGRNFQGMNIGNDDTNIITKLFSHANLMARTFVRNYSDMAMIHVAAYNKGYQRAAHDVAVLMDESGVEPIIHDDISTHMSACVGGSISGMIVIFTGFILVHQRNKSPDYQDISDSSVVVNMLLAFVLCYTLIFTVMEPLRASIKAVYVCFAQYPSSLSQAYPLIFQRLRRMSESNVSSSTT